MDLDTDIPGSGARANVFEVPADDQGFRLAVLVDLGTPGGAEDNAFSDVVGGIGSGRVGGFSGGARADADNEDFVIARFSGLDGCASFCSSDHRFVFTTTASDEEETEENKGSL